MAVCQADCYRCLAVLVSFYRTNSDRYFMLAALAPLHQWARRRFHPGCLQGNFLSQPQGMSLGGSFSGTLYISDLLQVFAVGESRFIGSQ